MPVTETLLSARIFDQLRLAMAADPDAFTDLYRDYLADAWQSLQILQEAVGTGQVEMIRAKAHYLKSGSLVLGAPDVARGAAMLEEAAMAGDSDSFDALLERIATAVNDTQAELSERLGSGVIPGDDTAT